MNWNTGLKFQGCKLTLQLEAQAPMIHFQSNESGATIRASEVKPKLDRFLLRKLRKDHNVLEQLQLQTDVTSEQFVEALQKSSEYKKIFIDPSHQALDYKMTITVKKQGERFDLGDRECKFDIFYGNMGREENMMGVISDPVITIMCFREKIKTLLEQYLVEFFMVTNFGTMQNKGFGSFVPAEFCQLRAKLSAEEERQIAEYLKMETLCTVDDKKSAGKSAPTKCYCMRFDQTMGAGMRGRERVIYAQRMFREIKSFYGIMKTGRSFGGYLRSYIYQYMHEKGIGNEKAWMKQNGISPKVAKPENVKKVVQMDKNPRYVRAMLGVGVSIRYIEKLVERDGKWKPAGFMNVSIEHAENTIERASSPIYFKIVRNVVFIVAKEIPKELFDIKFVFQGHWGRNHQKDQRTKDAEKRGLRTPKEQEFDIQDFLNRYAEFYNGQKVSKKVGEVR